MIVGLGNPGKRYELTRHNVGFLVVDEFVERTVVSGGAPSWKSQDGALLSAACLSGERLVVIKPQGFMNLSGEPVRRVRDFYRFENGRIVVVHDDIDLPFGVLRVCRGRGDGGHNGVRSVTAALGDNDYFRLRVGVGRPDEEKNEGQPREVKDWVLAGFNGAERFALEDVLQRGARALEVLCLEGLVVAQREFNG